MALVTLVVVGHSWVMLPDTGLTDHFYDFLYTWHVPAFVFVTGYLSQRFAWTKVRLWQLVRTVAVPYVIFECALALFRIYVGGEHMQDLFRDPHWPMWYLSALFFWRLLTPLFKPLPAGLLVAVGVSLVAGMYAGNTLDMARVLGLLPFFVMGLKATPERLEWLRRRPAQVAAVGVFVGLWVLTTWTDSWAGTEWLYYRSRYGDMGAASDLHALATRLLVLALGTLGAWAFFALVPRIDGWYTRMGAWTLVVYLFHGFVIKSLEYADYGNWWGGHIDVAFVITTLGAVGVAVLLASRPVATRLQDAVDPLGFGERHVGHAVDLAIAKDVVQPEVQAELETRIDETTEVQRARSAAEEQPAAR
jgi:fucose 4-O-acetylase-like acetyltransferase